MKKEEKQKVLIEMIHSSLKKRVQVLINCFYEYNDREDIEKSLKMALESTAAILWEYYDRMKEVGFKSSLEGADLPPVEIESDSSLEHKLGYSVILLNYLIQDLTLDNISDAADKFVSMI